MAGKRLGPGPGAYRLPTTIGYAGHDPSRIRNPMYSFGARGPGRLSSLGPGPAYRVGGVTYNGPITCPAWSFGSRHPAKGYTKTPGPAAHAPELCPPMREQRAPAFSFGARLGRDSARRPGPAPNAYLLRTRPTMPAWTMAPRLLKDKGDSTPGPATYYQRDINVFRQKFPVYSLGVRLEGRGKSRTPGPAAYPCFTLFNTKKNAYSYSFGTRHAEWAPPLVVRDDEMDCLPYNVVKPKAEKLQSS